MATEETNPIDEVEKILGSRVAALLRVTDDGEQKARDILAKRELERQEIAAKRDTDLEDNRH